MRLKATRLNGDINGGGAVVQRQQQQPSAPAANLV